MHRQLLLLSSLVFLRAFGLVVPDTRDVVSGLTNYNEERSPFDNVQFEVLEPISDHGKLGKRAESLDLQNAMRLLWGGENGSAILDADYPGADEHVLNMEDFLTTILTVSCSTGQVLVDFATQAAFDLAKTKWIWVNQMAARHFFIIVKHAGCGTPVLRRPYNITNVGFDSGKKRAMLNGIEVTYESCVHDGHLLVETAPDPVTNPIVPRASIGKAVSINKDFSGNIFRLGTAPNVVSLDCVDCGTKGILKVKLDVSIRFSGIKQAFVEFRAEGVSARVNIALSGQASQSTSGSKEVVRVDIIGIDIPGIARLSFGPAFGVGWSVGVQGSGSVTIGANSTLTPVSVGTVCLKGCTTSSQGFNITTIKKPLAGQGNFNVSGNVFTYVTLSAGARIFKTSYEAGVAVKAPSLIGSVNVLAKSQGGVCNNPATKLGVEANLAVGIHAFAYFGRDFTQPSSTVQIFSRYDFLFQQCFPL